MTLFMTTHYMDEAEDCDRIAMIDGGRIVALGTPAELKAMVGGDVVTIATADNVTAAAQISRARREPMADAGSLRVEVPDAAAFVPAWCARRAWRSPRSRSVARAWTTSFSSSPATPSATRRPERWTTCA